MKKIIFLDLDGVLNTGHYQCLLRFSSEPCKDKYGVLFDPNAVVQLKRIVDATGADIVIESSWKYLELEVMRKLWAERNLPGKVIDITSSYISDEYLLNADLDNLDDSMHHCKGIEIESWLYEHRKQDARYVIIDDEYVVLESQLNNFILTDSFQGITEEQANQAISILNE